VKLLVPVVLGVPEITPVLAFRERPAGRVPTEIVQAYWLLPPVAVSVALYATDLLPLGSAGVVMAKDELIVIPRAFDAVLDPESVISTVKLLVPTVVGIPLISPKTPIDKPGGSTPAVIVRV